MNMYKSSTALKRLQALGRKKQGELNKTEQAYSNYLNDRMHAGDILWFSFEGIKLRLADKTFLTVDFFVMNKDSELEAHEVKGYMFDDANVKLKVASSIYPFKFFLIRVNPKKSGGGWKITEI